MIGYLAIKRNGNKMNKLKLLSRTLPFLYAYSLILYFLTIQNPEVLGWEAYTILFFLIPVTVIVLILQIISAWKRSNKAN